VRKASAGVRKPDPFSKDEHATRIMAAAGKTQPAEAVELRGHKK